MDTANIWVELDGTEFNIEFEYDYYYQAAKLTGPWESCHPEEEEFEFNVISPKCWMSALEELELSEIPEEIFFEAVQEDMAAERECRAADMYDSMRDDMIGGCL